MGIRFEYGARKATNGPMIFFSDPVSEVNLQEEIRGAIESRLCFYAYRLPGDMMVSFGSSEGAVEGIGIPGFVIAPFLPGGKPYTIPYAPTPRNNTQEEYPFPDHSTRKEEYITEIETIKDEIGAKDNCKIVAARVLVMSSNVDVAASFMRLLSVYPEAYIFCFSTPQTGCWIGASPELLLNGKSGVFSTMALAGTRKAFSPGQWDQKNIKEQKMVADYIISTLKDFGLNVDEGETITKNAGNVEHLCTPIKAYSPTGNSDPADLSSLLHSLSPTPATAGVPRQRALDIITSSEHFQRAFYGGFCGPYRSTDEFTFSVMLRCARVESGRAALFVGGGITAYSEPEKEWEETEMKLATLDKLLIEEDTIN